MPTSDPNCIFCKIIAGEIPSKLVAETDECIAIRDVNPQAPTHVLVIPKEHVSNITKVTDAKLLGTLFQKASDVAQKENIAADGFRLVVNTGDNGGQTVHHLHIHVIGGRAMKWPPG